MITLRLAHVNKSEATMAFDGPLEEVATLLGKLYSSFFFDPSLNDLIDKNQVGQFKNALTEVAKNATA
jgi:hypothetical protein